MTRMLALALAFFACIALDVPAGLVLLASLAIALRNIPA